MTTSRARINAWLCSKRFLGINSLHLLYVLGGICYHYPHSQRRKFGCREVMGFTQGQLPSTKWQSWDLSPGSRGCPLNYWVHCLSNI